MHFLLCLFLSPTEVSCSREAEVRPLPCWGTWAWPMGMAQGNLLCANSLSFLDAKSWKAPRRNLGRSVLKKTRQPGSLHYCMEQSPRAPHHQRRQHQDNVNSRTNGGLHVRALNVILANVPPMHGSNSNALLCYQLLL